MAADPDRPGDHDDEVTLADETTLADEEWPVAEHYRVEPLPDGDAPPETPATAAPNGSAESATTVAAPARPPRRFPPRLRSPLAAVLAAAAVLALLLVAGAALLAGGEDEARTAPPPTATGGEQQTDTEAQPPTTTRPTVEEGRPVPDVTGATLAEARSVLEEAGLEVEVRRVAADASAGDVIRQSPAGGSDIAENGTVLLTVSSGPEQVEVPDLTGATASEARSVLREAGLRSQVRRVESSERAGTVLRQSPAPGTEVDADTVVRLDVAEAPPTVDVPRLVGLPASDARQRLRQLGLASTVARVDSERPEGTVVDQSPAAGADLERGETVSLTVSSGPAPVSVPDVLGQDEQSAQQQLEAAGFTVEVVDEPTTDPAEDGLVVGQSPSAGAQRRPGTTVTIRVARLG